MIKNDPILLKLILIYLSLRLSWFTGINPSYCWRSQWLGSYRDPSWCCSCGIPNVAFGHGEGGTDMLESQAAPC